MAAQLTKGQVDRLTHDEVVVSVRHSEPVDVSALLLNSAGRVRDETDLIFYNQPAAHGVRLASGRPELSIGLRSLPPEIEHVRIVASLEEQQDHFGDYPPPQLVVADPSGNAVYEYTVDGLGEEPAVIVADLDRVGSTWQVRPLGHGFPAGFAALVTAHGVAVGGGADELPYRGPAVLAPGQEVALNQIRQGELSMVKMGVGWDPMKVHGPRGLRSLEIDLDASALLFVGQTLVDVAFYQQLSSRDGAVRHSGDNLTGDGKGDDEVITVDLARLPAPVTAVVFVVTSYAGHTFERIRNGYWRMVDGSSTAELARGNLRGGGPHTGMVVAKVYRDGGIWRVASIGAPIQAGHPVEAVPLVIPML
ncbi:TerD family protein [Nocardia africana]|uniref:Stress response protein SCP2 n=1 Tax=Nocardia africana TaxID=134964 RepID=A0A378WWZ6_9NOCA|nr:TerD family protein [Nocardia africana]MCC3313265.1 TerD family protein [Nocardia africana]SUA45382.1 Stress response protein SCP2 [Nocardia africana]